MAGLRWWEIVALTAAALAQVVAIAGATDGVLPGRVPATLAAGTMVLLLALAVCPGPRHRRGSR
jgi:hypothetical protein